MMGRTGTYKVILPMHGDAGEPMAVVWRNSQEECETWIDGRHAVEPTAAVLDYEWDGPVRPVTLDYAVVDRIRPEGYGRIVERFSAPEEARGWIDNQVRWERTSPQRGDYAVVDEAGLHAALRSAPTVIAPGGAVILDINRPGASKGDARPDLARFESTAVIRVVNTRLGPVEARQYADGHFRVSAGELVDAASKVPPVSVTWDGFLSNKGGRGRIERRAHVSFEAVGSVDANRLVPMTLGCEIRDAQGWPIKDGDVAAEIRREVWLAAGDAATEMSRMYPNERLEALDRHYEGRIDAIDRRRVALVAEVERLDRMTSDLLSKREAVARLIEAAAPEAETAPETVPAPR